MALHGLRVVITAVALAISGSVVYAGSWVVITMKNVPTHLMAGERTFIYTVRQHGHAPMNDLAGLVEARKGATVVHAAARPLSSMAGVRSPGAYVVDLRLPEPGRWTVNLTAGSGLLGDTMTLTVEVLPIGGDAPAVSESERGRQLFEGKGCVTCHAHPEFSGRRIVNVLDISAKRYTPEYVQAFLTSVARPGTTSNKMPDLGLSAPEIDALAAFLGR
jgi:hypothetical protein